MNSPDNALATHDIAREVAKHLGGGWTYDTKLGRSHDGALWPMAYITCRDDDGFLNHSIGFHNHQGRLTISLRYSEDARALYLSIACPKIGCSPSKDASKIAKDITRRLLPAMVPAAAEIDAALASAKAHDDGLAATRTAVLESPHVKAWGDDGGLKLTTKASAYSNTIDLHSDGTVTLRLADVTAAQALTIIALLNA